MEAHNPFIFAACGMAGRLFGCSHRKFFANLSNLIYILMFEVTRGECGAVVPYLLAI